jgi:hypothetical protein
VIALTPQGRALRAEAGCLGDTLLAASGQSPAQLGDLNGKVRRLRDAIYDSMGSAH